MQIHLNNSPRRQRFIAMGERGFFRPTRGKVVLAILFSILAITGAVLASRLNSCAGEGSGDACSPSAAFRVSQAFSTVFGMTPYPQEFPYQIIRLAYSSPPSYQDKLVAAMNIIGIPFLILYNYLLACIVAFLFFRVSGKRGTDEGIRRQYS